MFSELTAIGNLGADPEIKTISDGVELAKFRIAVKNRGKDAGTTWWSVTAWRGKAKYCSFLKKGDLVFVKGAIKSREYTNKDGIKVTAYEVEADEIKGLGKRAGNNEQRPNNNYGSQFDDEIPPF